MKDCAIHLFSNQGTLPETNSSSQVENGELEYWFQFWGPTAQPGRCHDVSFRECNLSHGNFHLRMRRMNLSLNWLLPKTNIHFRP